MPAQDSSDPTGVRAEHNTKQSLVRARERKANAALQMRLAGATWNDIAEVIGYPTPRQAVIAVERALEKELSTEQSQAKMRSMAGQRLDRLLRSVWTKALNPESPEHLQAITKARELIAQHAKLYGLDAPTEVVVHNPTAHELEQWVATVVSAKSPPIDEWDIFEGEVVEGEDPDDGPLAITGG